jgi:hypothetical protein
MYYGDVSTPWKYRQALSSPFPGLLASPSLYDWPTGGEADLVPAEEFLAIGVADTGIDIVVIQDLKMVSIRPHFMSSSGKGY